MATMDISNSAENIKEFLTAENKNDLMAILEDFQAGHFSEVLSKTKPFREKYDVDESFARHLSLFDAVSYTQIEDVTKATAILKTLYQGSSEKSIDDLMTYGSVAYLCDLKLARRIISDAVNQLENEEPFDESKAAQAYLLLGQTEDTLGKLNRAIKYYTRSLTYFQKEKEQDKQLILFLHYKLGGLNSMIYETDAAIAYLEKTIELAEEGNDKEVKINSLVSMAKMYGNKGDYEKSFTYLNEALPLFEDSTLNKKLVHAEAFTDMAYNHFALKQYDEAIPYYEKGIAIFQELPQNTARDLGMMYMQYAYCLDHKEQPNLTQAGIHYENAITQLEETNDYELLENALADTIEFFDRTKNKNKKRFYENKFVKLTNEKAQNF